MSVYGLYSRVICIPLLNTTDMLLHGYFIISKKLLTYVKYEPLGPQLEI